MAARKVIIGDQEIEIPDFNFKITPIVTVIVILWLLTGIYSCLLYTSPSPRDATLSRMPSSA